jgi:glycine oxidase
MSAKTTDVVVIGDGVIGLSTALELGRAGARCLVFGAVNHGAASGAAAGLLAPSIGSLRPEIQTFFDASLALYPGFVDSLRTFEPELVLLEGLLDLSAAVASSESSRGQRLSVVEVSRIEPGVAPREAVFHARDAAIDNGILVRALRRGVTELPTCAIVADDPVIAIEPGFPLTVQTRAGRTIQSDAVVLAAGAWSARITGLPRRLPVAPLKGQMLAVASRALRHAVMAEDVYLVPRGAEIAIGATAEHAGFDTTVVPEAIERLRQFAVSLCPALADAPVTRTWSGIRPATPDMLPILGADPTLPGLFYACGHSKNGILLAPATAQCITALVARRQPPFDVGPFSIERFSERRIG